MRIWQEEEEQAYMDGVCPSLGQTEVSVLIGQKPISKTFLTNITTTQKQVRERGYTYFNGQP